AWDDHFRLRFPRPPPCRLLSCSHGHSIGNPMKPTAQGLPFADRASPPGQDEERRLEGVLRVLLVAEYPAADAEHQGAVSLDQVGERGLVVAGREGSDQLAVGSRPAPLQRAQPPNVPDDGTELCVDHGVASLGSVAFSLLVRGRGKTFGRFYQRPSLQI